MELFTESAVAILVFCLLCRLATLIVAATSSTTIHTELHARERSLARVSKRYERAVRSDCGEAALEDAVDCLTESADAWATAFERVTNVEAAPGMLTARWGADQES